MTQNDRFYFSPRQLEHLLGTSVVPSVMQKAWDSALSIYNNFPDVPRNNYHAELFQEGIKPVIHREDGVNCNIFNRDLVADKSFYEVSYGYDSDSVTLSLGIVERREEHQERIILDQNERMTVWVDYTDSDNLEVRFSFDSLGLPNPRDSYQARRTLEIIGGAMSDIRHGTPLDWNQLKHRLESDAGLKTGTHNKSQPMPS